MLRLLNASAKGLTLLLCGMLIVPPQLFAAPPVAAGTTNTSVAAAANGVPVVNIATPNASGLSHNKYTSYNVDPQGLVLNNGDASQAFRQSQLAGLVAANPNLATGNQARVILNEVTGGGRSTLAGFTEVLGGKADVIVANPFGITCNGCGFINTDRASLVTGAPNLTGGALGFDVRGGDILISGTGINANAQQILDLVSRKIDVQGQVNAKTLNMVAGANNWDHTTGAANVIASDGTAAPAYAIDSSALGGMYAGRISLKATEAGVGVRIQREAAATADDFTITSAGKIEVTSKLSAARDMALTSTATGADAIKATDANLSAARNLALNASLGGATLTGGGIVAGGQLAYNLGSLTDTASATADITDANKRYGATTNLLGTGAWSINGVSYGAGSALGLSTQSLTLGNTAATTFYSGGTMNLSTVDAFTLGNTGLQSVGDMTLRATDPNGLLDIGSQAQAKSTGGNLNLYAGDFTKNAGTLATTVGDIVIRSGIGPHPSTTPIQRGFLNTGSIWAGNLLDVADRNGAATQQLAISGTGKMGGNTANIQAWTFRLADSAVLSSIGDMRIAISTSDSTVTSGAKILGVTGGVGTLTMSTTGGWQNFYNFGLVHSGQDLDASTTGIGADSDNTGTVSAARNLKLKGFDNMYGNFIAGNNLSIDGSATLFPNANGSPNAMLSAGNDINITAYDFCNWSVMNAGHDISIVANHFFSNTIGHSGNMHLLYLAVVPNPDPSAPLDFYVVRNTSYTPQIIAGNAITITTGTRLSENVGLISARTVNLNGAGMRNGGTISGTTVNISNRNLENFAGGTGAPGTVTGTSLAPTPTPGGISFGGVTVTLPTTPNGLFVPAQGNTSNYLVESNPLYTNIDNFLGSDYLAEKYNFKADDVTKRLGDAAYETYLVQQQLIALTGSNMVVAGASTEKVQMQALMDHAGTQAKSLGLTYGTALTAAQQSSLKSDMVWMVETTVNGQKVLTPVVYLAASTRELFAGGGLVAADTLTANVGSLTNTGTMRGNTVDISATGDVQNLGGTISGGDVSVASTGGSVINSAQVSEQVIKKADGHIDLKTTVGKAGTIQGTNVSLSAAKNVENVGGSIKGGSVNIAAGGDVVNSALVATNVSGSQYRETVAATGSIESTGNLNIQAGRDVQNLGGQMKAGGDANIQAGRDVTFDTVELTNRDSSTRSTRSFVKNSNSRTTTTSITQVQGGVEAGGALTMKAGQDVTLAAANVSAGKSATIDAAGDLNILARNNSVQTVTESNANGLGVGGGVFGKEKKTTDQFSSRAVGSTLTTVKVGGAKSDLSNAKGSLANANTGGDITLSAGKTATLEGAKVSSAGGLNIAATDVKVLEARDVDRTTTHTETTSYLSTSGGDGNKSASGTKAGIKSDGVVKAGANASSTKDAGGVDLVKTTTTDTFDESTRAVGTQLAAGGGLNITAKNDATLRGADVKAGGDMSLSGQNVNILAAQDTNVSTSTSTTTKVGLYASSTNAADAKAGAGATAAAGIGSATAGAGANSSAAAASTNSLDVMRTRTTSTETVDITNQGSTLASGGNLKINSANTLTVQGSGVSGEKGVDLAAKDMAFLAAQDTHTSTTTTSSTSAGLYLDGTALAGAGANAGANAGLGANAGAKSEASAKAVGSLGVQGKNVASTSSEGTSTARVSSISSGSGSITRTAENSITDVGTDITAAENFSQSAKTWTNQAAANTSYSSSESTTNTGKVGLYAKGEAGASAEAGANAGLGLDGKPKAEAGTGAEAKAKVGAGVSVQYNRDALATTENTSEAVVSTIRAGGKIASATTGKTSLEGTQLSAGKGVELDAGSLDFSAAKNTASTTSKASNINAQASAGVSRGTGKGVDVDVAAGTSSTEKSSSASNAVAGGIESGGDIIIRTKGDTRLEGTSLAAVGDTTVAAGGNLNFEAARDTTSTSKTAYDASASVSTSDSKGAGGATSSGVDASVSGGFSKANSDSSTANAGSINTGGKLTLSAGKAASFEGTKMAAGGDASIDAKDGVTISAAKSTANSESYGARVGLTAGSGKESTSTESSSSKSASGTVEANYSRSKDVTAEAGSLVSGGNLKINSGKDVNLEGTTLAADGKASVLAGGNVNFTAAESSSESIGVGVSVSASAEKTNKTPTAAPAAPTKAAKAGNPGTGGTQGSDGSAQSNKDLATWQKNQSGVLQELKDKQNAKAAAAAAPATSTTTAAPAAAPAASATGAEASGPTTETKSSASLGVQVQNKSKTTQQAGSISSGAGGVEIVAKGGDVNLVGTDISTGGDANISAARDVNISATRNTESGFSVAVAASADRSKETPTPSKTPGKTPASTATGTPAAGAAGATPSATKTPPPAPTAPKPASARADAAAAARAPQASTGTPASTPAASTASASGTSAKKTPPPVPTAPKPARQAGSTAPTASAPASTSGAASTPSASSPTGASKKTPPPAPTAPKPASARADAAAAARAPQASTGTPASTPAASTASASGTSAKKTPPPVPTAPKPARQAGSTAPTATASTSTSGAASTPSASSPTGASKKTPPPAPTAPKPASARADAAAAARAAAPAASTASAPADATTAGAATAAQSATAQAAAAPAAPAKEDGSSTFGGSVSRSTNTDENKSGAFVGGTGGSRTTNKGATIKTRGALNITSGGKTTLTNTNVQATSGENIDAAGGVERKTVRDSGVNTFSTDSGPAGTGQAVSKVPTATANPATGAPASSGASGAPGSTGATTASDASQGSSIAPQSIKSAQGGGAGGGIKKN